MFVCMCVYVCVYMYIVCLCIVSMYMSVHVHMCVGSRYMFLCNGFAGLSILCVNLCVRITCLCMLTCMGEWVHVYVYVFA